MTTVERRLVLTVGDIRAVSARCPKCKGELRKVYGKTETEVGLERALCGFCGTGLMPMPNVASRFLKALDDYREFEADVAVEVALEIDLCADGPTAEPGL